MFYKKILVVFIFFCMSSFSYGSTVSWSEGLCNDNRLRQYVLSFADEKYTLFIKGRNLVRGLARGSHAYDVLTGEINGDNLIVTIQRLGHSSCQSGHKVFFKLSGQTARQYRTENGCGSVSNDNDKTLLFRSV
tara:strand:+ start:358 stop:756 length:399 start_codon:yes stop_codon:yes gene_type:complete